MPPGAEQFARPPWWAEWWTGILTDPTATLVVVAIGAFTLVATVVCAVYQVRQYLLQVRQARLASAPLQRQDPDTLRAQGLVPPHPDYVERGVDRETLCRHRRLAFVGPAKTGKTREAVWTALALYDGAQSRRAIFVARPPLEVPTTVPHPDVEQPIVIVDDIARMGRPQRHEHGLSLPTVLDQLASLEHWLDGQYRDGWWVILTSRLGDWQELTGAPAGGVLRAYQTVELQGIEGAPEERYVHSVCKFVGWNAPDEALTKRFARLNDGTFLSLHEFLVIQKREHPERTDLTEDDAEAFRHHRDTAWQEERRRLPRPQCELLDALALLRQIGAPLYGPLAVEMCCGPLAFLRGPRYRRALEALCRTWLRQEPGGIVSTHDSHLQRDEPAADGEILRLAGLLLRFSRGRRHRAASPPLLAAAYAALEEPCRRSPDLHAFRLRLADRELSLAPDDPSPAARAGIAEYELGLVRDAARHLRRAIGLHARALERWTEQDAPREWAGAQINLGNVWSDLPTGDRGENLQRAIASHHAALRVYTERDYPTRWAATQNNLGRAWADLPAGDRGDNLKRAITCYEAALRVYTQRDYRAEWAITQNNLGNAWSQLPTGDRGENLRRGISCFEAALRVRTGRDYPADWAMTQNNLAVAWQNLPTGDRAENLQRAIACYEAALRVRTERHYPVDWAITQNNLGTAWVDLPAGDRGENLKRAIACHEASLRVRTERDRAVDWAMTQNNLAVAWQNLPTGDRAENLQRAIACYEAALRVRTERDYPADWAVTQFNFALLLEQLPSGDAVEDLARALCHAENSLRGFQAAGMPRDAVNAQRLIGWLKAKLEDSSEEPRALPP